MNTKDYRKAKSGEKNLRGADLRDVDLRGADLRDVDLRGAYLSGANLRDANLRVANLRGANFRSADLSDADLRDADLWHADLWHADLSGAGLKNADLSGAKNIGDYLRAITLVTPEYGSYTAWKKCRYDVIVELKIPARAKRSSATSRKCRAEYVKVVEVIGANVGVSKHDGKTVYRKGETVYCDEWDDDRWNECSGGIHHFITRWEAENY